MKLFETHKVYSATELKARHEVKLESYVKVINIEAQTMLDMTRKDFLPAMSAYTAKLSGAVTAKRAVQPDVDCTYERDTLKSVSALMGSAYRAVVKLEEDLIQSQSIDNAVALADFFKITILEDMHSLRLSVDTMETFASAKEWPVPTYGDILFSVR